MSRNPGEVLFGNYVQRLHDADAAARAEAEALRAQEFQTIQDNLMLTLLRNRSEYSTMFTDLRRNYHLDGNPKKNDELLVLIAGLENGAREKLRALIRIGVPKENRDNLDLPIGELHLSLRARKGLARLGIQTIGQLLLYASEDLLELKNFGETTLREVQTALSKFNLSLRSIGEDEMMR